MTKLEAPEELEFNPYLPSVDEVYFQATSENPDISALNETEVKQVVAQALGQVSLLEDLARQPVQLTDEQAHNIETIFVFSGTGSYDQPFKPEDNPKLISTAWMGGWDRARLSRAAYLARKIAEKRAGYQINSGSIADLDKRLKASKDLIAEYGPSIVYNGYPAENQNLEKLLDREGIIIPSNNVKIINGDLRTTADQITTFEYPERNNAKDKDVVMISHAPHLGARILRILNHFDTLTDGSVPYLSPIATSEAGRYDFALMEVRGLLSYIYSRKAASEQVHPFKLLGYEEVLE